MLIEFSAEMIGADRPRDSNVVSEDGFGALAKPCFIGLGFDP